ncbi:MAG: cyclase family protein [Spirochaetaceae bacterium]|jgi:kynurenine formamidase|nr:cyclase family protein [Spirochaetaceae bacterium]
MRYYDMSVPLYHNCPAWPGRALPEVKLLNIHGVDGTICERFTFDVHTGTHLDAPYHFFPSGITIDQIPLDAFCGTARLVNLKGITACAAIGTSELEKQCAAVKKDDIVLIRTGWTEKRGFSSEYYHDWPYLSREGAEFLLAKEVKGVGIDTMSMGGWHEGTGRPCHEVLLGAGVWLVEELYFPEELMAYTTCQFCAVPLKLKGAGGSPTRAFATTD